MRKWVVAGAGGGGGGVILGHGTSARATVNRTSDHDSILFRHIGYNKSRLAIQDKRLVHCTTQVLDTNKRQNLVLIAEAKLEKLDLDKVSHLNCKMVTCQCHASASRVQLSQPRESVVRGALSDSSSILVVITAAHAHVYVHRNTRFAGRTRSIYRSSVRG